MARMVSSSIGHLVAPAGAVVGDRQRVLGHEPAPPWVARRWVGVQRDSEYNLSRVRSATRISPEIASVQARAQPRLPRRRRPRRARGGPRRSRSAAETDGGLALTRILAEELAAGRRDLQALAHRWVARYQADPRDIDPETAAALAHIARHDAPPSQAAGPGQRSAGARAAGGARGVRRAPHPGQRQLPYRRADAPRAARRLVGRRGERGARPIPPGQARLRARRGRGAAEQRRCPRRCSRPCGGCRCPRARARRAATPCRARPLRRREAALRLAYHEPLLERGLRAVAAPGRGGARGRAGARRCAARRAGWRRSRPRGLARSRGRRATPRARRWPSRLVARRLRWRAQRAPASDHATIHSTLNGSSHPCPDACSPWPSSSSPRPPLRAQTAVDTAGAGAAHRPGAWTTPRSWPTSAS